jgi:hypothetical protein
MKTISTTVMLFFFVCLSVSAQWMKKDTVLNNVVRIEEKDVAQMEGRCLVDVPLFLGNTGLTIYNNSSLPNSMLFTPPIFDCPMDLLLISPNKEREETKFYKVRVGNFYGGGGWTRQDIKVDSMSLPNNKCPKLNYHSFEADTDFVHYFYAEGHGSIFSEDDLNNRKTPTINDFIKSYEDKHGIKIPFKVYSKTLGYEGEGISCFVLEGLSPCQTLEFILEKDELARKALSVKEEIDSKNYMPQKLYIPSRFYTGIRTKRLKK